MSHTDFKMVVMLVIIFSFLGIFGLAEVIRDLYHKVKSLRRSTRLYQGEL